MHEKSEISKPTDAEFKILSVIWDRQSTTVREVFNQLNENEKIGYLLRLKNTKKLIMTALKQIIENCAVFSFSIACC